MLWSAILVVADFVFYVVLTPIWIGLRAVAWLAEFRRAPALEAAESRSAPRRSGPTPVAAASRHDVGDDLDELRAAKYRADAASSSAIAGREAVVDEPRYTGRRSSSPS